MYVYVCDSNHLRFITTPYITQAYQYLSRTVDAPERNVRLSVSIPGKGRGIYLREHADTSKAHFEEAVLITPLFSDSTPANTKIAFGVSSLACVSVVLWYTDMCQHRAAAACEDVCRLGLGPLPPRALQRGAPVHSQCMCGVFLYDFNILLLMAT